MIPTTVVGSYPVPAWLRVYNTRESLRDAMLVVLKTQELAGIDVVADGELYRWDINHPETNGMIDYFVRPLEGIQVELTLDQRRAWRQKAGMVYRSQPAGIVTGPLGHGRLDLARDYALYRDLTQKPKKFTVTSPYMLAKVLEDAHYGSLDALVAAPVRCSAWFGQAFFSQLLHSGCYPPRRPARVFDPTTLVFVVLLDRCLDRCGPSFEGQLVGGVNIRDVNVRVGRDWRPPFATVCEHDYGVSDANLCVHQPSSRVREAAQFDRSEGSDEEVDRAARPIDNQVRRDSAVALWLERHAHGFLLVRTHLSAAQLVILSRERLDNDGPKSVHPEVACAGLEKRGYADSTWSCVKLDSKPGGQHVHQLVVPCLRHPRL